ncbi:SpvB/TcaC N-terminal domain-containing protein [Nocardia sp. NPDC057030]|uniref:SpvB/TcaC N-terminal domain-containing protein n=1 Tax=unclassified Nocardia TaxID=2637762 RepID=UPI003638D939
MPDDFGQGKQGAERTDAGQPGSGGPTAPTIALPKGGGAIKGIGEKFAANPVTGTGSLTVPISVSPGRGGFGPQLALAYDSGAGNGPFGLGWSLGLPAITRKTDKGLPRYDDSGESDVFILSGAEDLAPVLVEQQGNWVREVLPVRTVGGIGYRVQRYRPRVEGLFARIERWTNLTDARDISWRSISRDNVTTWYGRDARSRIADPGNPEHIFSWLICLSYDDKGNVVSYEYKAENAELVADTANELQRERRANRYPKRIRYGNHTPYFPTLDPVAAWPAPPADDQWYFELVFDYGEHDLARPLPADEPGWGNRPDPFSSYRSGFEVRTHRLCRRALMFHHFPEEAGVGADCLVRSTDFGYAHDLDPANERNPIHAELTSVTQRGYRRTDSGYRSRALPPVEFGYREARIQGEVRELDRDSLAGLPIGVDGAEYQWVDLDGDGVAGILTEQDGGWFYKRNLSPAETAGTAARLAAPELVAPLPAASLAAGARFVDLAGDGQPDVVRFDGPDPGFHERDDASWSPFAPFDHLPNHDWHDPNLRFVDLDGDGLIDVLISEQDAFLWYPSLGEAGFGPQQRVATGRDENRGPAVIFADSEQTVQLADMSGDGLTDLVRIRNGEVCYWPNLGYGHFGRKITMDNPPWFDHPDQFDSQRVLIADIDGSGTTDIIYLHADGVRVYLNHSGNSWRNPVSLPVFPPVAEPIRVQTLDLLGNGTACLVWSSPLAGDAHSPLRYLDLMGGQKPHLLVTVKNNLGAETEIGYTPSTTCYLADKLAGKPWATKLPFPVHVVDHVTVRDRWRNTTFTSTYSYHHGYFDGPEREFRGFGRVEQIDTEDYGTFGDANTNSPYITQDHRLHQPPVKTVTWFHTGALIDGPRTVHQLAREYFPNWFEDLKPGTQVLGTFRERAVPELDLDARDLTADELREALRACRGTPLRQEVYELDADALANGQQRPVRLFSASSRGCHLHLVQPRKSNRHAVFHATESEAVTYHYELDLRPATLVPDPRIGHTLNLRVDEYGNVRQTVTVGYPRRQPAPLDDPLLPAGVGALAAAVQGGIHLAYTETRHTGDAIADQDRYRLRLPCETSTFELTGIAPSTDGYFGLDQLRGLDLSDNYPSTGTPVETIPYQQFPDGTRPQRRLIEHTRSLFFADALDRPLPFGTLNTQALPYEIYTLALTDALLTTVFGATLTPEATAALGDVAVSGYLSGRILEQRLGTDTAGQYWRCSGIAGYQPDAAQHFYLPERYTDPFGNITVLEYDSRDLFLRSSTDPLGNRTETIAFDLRVLAPSSVQDINGNRSQLMFDVLGMPTALALAGKQGEGDSLAEFADAATDPELNELIAFFVTDDYRTAAAQTLLGKATTRDLYYLGETIQNGTVVWGAHPPCAAGIMREHHASEAPAGPVQVNFAYSDGSGSVLVKKVQAEPESPGEALRWVASGKTILNNKGKPVKQYEPYFSPPPVGHRFEEPSEIGVTPVHFYDALGRRVRTEAPDGSVDRVDFSPWQITAHDPNDTVLDPGNAWYARMSASAIAAERRAAQLAAAHAGTPTLTLLDSLERAVLTIAHNRTDGIDEKQVTFTKLDAEGKPLWIQDARGSRVMQYVTPPLPGGIHPFDDPQNLAPYGVAPCYDVSGLPLLQHSMDAGDRWLLNDAAGTPWYGWNSRGFRTRTTYDALHRQVGVFVRASGDSTASGRPRDPAGPPEAEVLVELSVYGEAHPEAGNNLRGKTFQVYDGSGATTTERYDFKGNPLATARRFARDYQNTPDWSALADLTDLDRIAAAAAPLLETAPPLTTRTQYDALNRPTTVTAPDASVYRATFNEANLLERVDVNLRGAPTPTAFVTGIDYNAKGQRLRIDYGNGATTTYTYDPFVFRLAKLRTTRPADPDTTASLLFENATVVQDIDYVYDPVGNITRIEDSALATTVQAGAGSDYLYDALYRLVGATGREHSGQTDFALTPNDSNRRDFPFAGARIHPNDLQGLRDYVERYRYDAVGNVLRFVHHAGGNIDQPGQTRWQRRYQYALDSNRLLATSQPGDQEELPDYATTGGYSARYGYDAHGEITSMSHLPLMRWNHRGQLSATAQQVVAGGTPETTYYVYDSTGQRVRKITETSTGALKNQRMYLGGFEIYREHRGGTVTLERETLHVMDDQHRVAVVETSTTADSAERIRYQLGNHLGSASVELDEAGALVSFEEYHPYGSTAFQTGRSAAEVGLKRYRYTGKERDDETGMNYHTARYYLPWLGRWAGADPVGVEAGVNLYAYSRLSPVRFIDPHGTQERPVDPAQLTRDQVADIWTKSKNLDDFRFRLNLGPVDDATLNSYLTQKGILPQPEVDKSAPAVWPAGGPPARIEREIVVRPFDNPVAKTRFKKFATPDEAVEYENRAQSVEHYKASVAALGGIASIGAARAANHDVGAVALDTRATAWGAPVETAPIPAPSPAGPPAGAAPASPAGSPAAPAGPPAPAPAGPPPEEFAGLVQRLQTQVSQTVESLRPFQESRTVPYSLQVSAATGQVDGKPATLITLSNPTAHDLFARGVLQLPAGTALGPRPVLWKSKLPIGAHVERSAVGGLEEQGARGGFVTTSGNACFDCSKAWMEGKFPTWIHLKWSDFSGQWD